MPIARLLLPLLLTVVPAGATTIDFFNQGAFPTQIAPDRYLSSGVLLDTPSSDGLCIGDRFGGVFPSARQLFPCNDQSEVIRFTFVNPVTQLPSPSNFFGLTLMFGVLVNDGDPWELSIFDVNHDLLVSITDVPHTDDGGAGSDLEQILVSWPKFEFASAEFLTSGSPNLTGVDHLQFSQVPEPNLMWGTGLLLAAGILRRKWKFER